MTVFRLPCDDFSRCFLFPNAGAAGPIPALCVLPSWIDASSSAGLTKGGSGGGGRAGMGASLSPGFHDLGMMAMSSWKNTFVVGIYPEVSDHFGLLSTG